MKDLRILIQHIVVVWIFNMSFNFVEGEALIMALKNIAVSSGSACTSASLAERVEA